MMIAPSFSKVETANSLLIAYGFDNEFDKTCWTRAIEGQPVIVTLDEINRQESPEGIKDLIERRLLVALCR